MTGSEKGTKNAIISTLGWNSTNTNGWLGRPSRAAWRIFRRNRLAAYTKGDA